MVRPAPETEAEAGSAAGEPEAEPRRGAVKVVDDARLIAAFRAKKPIARDDLFERRWRRKRRTLAGKLLERARPVRYWKRAQNKRCRHYAKSAGPLAAALVAGAWAGLLAVVGGVAVTAGGSGAGGGAIGAAGLRQDGVQPRVARDDRGEVAAAFRALAGAGGWRDLLGHVRNPVQVEGLMSGYYARQPFEAPGAVVVTKAVSRRVGGRELVDATVLEPAGEAGGARTARTATFERTLEGLKLDWESWVDYGGFEWERVTAAPAGSRAWVRVRLEGRGTGGFSAPAAFFDDPVEALPVELPTSDGLRWEGLAETLDGLPVPVECIASVEVVGGDGEGPRRLRIDGIEQFGWVRGVAEPPPLRMLSDSGDGVREAAEAGSEATALVAQLEAEAVHCFERFLSAESAVEKAQFVIGGDRVLPEMIEYYDRDQHAERIEPNGLRYPAGSMPLQELEKGRILLVGKAAGRRVFLFFEEGKLAWDAYVQVNDHSLARFLSDPGSGAGEFAVIIGRSHATVETGQFAVAIRGLGAVPDGVEVVAQLPAGSQLAHEVAQLAWDVGRTARVEMRWRPGITGRPSVEVTRFVGWDVVTPRPADELLEPPVVAAR